MPPPTSTDPRGRSTVVDTRIYSLTAILRSAYLFTGRAYLHLQWESATEILVRLRPKEASLDPDAVLGEFLNDLIDQRLREVVGRETQNARDLILAHALSRTALLHPELESRDPFASPSEDGGR